MTVRRDQRTDRWYFRARVTYDSGKRERISGTPGVSGPYHDLPNTKAGAQAAENRAIAKALTGQLVRPEHREVPTIRAYVEEHSDVRTAAHKPSARRDSRQRLEHDILPAVGDLRLDELRQQHVDEIVATMLDRDCSRKTINNSLGALSAIVRYAIANGVIGDRKLGFSIKAQDVEIEPVAAEDVPRMLDAAPDDRYRAGILLAADAGLRIGEIRALEWLDINEVQRELVVERSYDRTGELSGTKGWKRRTVSIGERLSGLGAQAVQRLHRPLRHVERSVRVWGVAPQRRVAVHWQDADLLRPHRTDRGEDPHVHRQRWGRLGRRPGTDDRHGRGRGPGGTRRPPRRWDDRPCTRGAGRSLVARSCQTPIT